MAYLNGCCRESGLGFLPLATIASTAGTVEKVASSIPIIGGLFTDSKDPERLAKNANYDSLCRSGNQDACVALKYMSGRFGLTKEGQFCNVGGCSGWATQKAKDDAYSRWQAISQPSSVSSGGGYSPTPITAASVIPSVGGMSPLVLIGIAGLTMLAFSKR